MLVNIFFGLLILLKNIWILKNIKIKLITTIDQIQIIGIMAENSGNKYESNKENDTENDNSIYEPVEPEGGTADSSSPEVSDHRHHLPKDQDSWPRDETSEAKDERTGQKEESETSDGQNKKENPHEKSKEEDSPKKKKKRGCFSCCGNEEE